MPEYLKTSLLARLTSSWAPVMSCQVEAVERAQLELVVCCCRSPEVSGRRRPVAEPLDHELELRERQVERGQVQVFVIELVIRLLWMARLMIESRLSRTLPSDSMGMFFCQSRYSTGAIPRFFQPWYSNGNAVRDLEQPRGRLVGGDRLVVGVAGVGHARPRVGLDRPRRQPPPPVEDPLVQDPVDVVIGVVAVVRPRAAAAARCNQTAAKTARIGATRPASPTPTDRNGDDLRPCSVYTAWLSLRCPVDVGIHPVLQTCAEGY